MKTVIVNQEGFFFAGLSYSSFHHKWVPDWSEKRLILFTDKEADTAIQELALGSFGYRVGTLIKKTINFT